MIPLHHVKASLRLQEGFNVSLSKKLACGDLFRQVLSECFRTSAETPRPPGKAGRYEQESEGPLPLRHLPKRFFDSLGTAAEMLRSFCVLRSFLCAAILS